jgi:putative IMPACT (imprinted ancient) family translation regulator
VYVENTALGIPLKYIIILAQYDSRGTECKYRSTAVIIVYLTENNYIKFYNKNKENHIGHATLTHFQQMCKESES